MAGSQISGIVSGLDTGTIIKQLMQLEAQPQTLLRNKQTATTSMVSALQSLNAKVASLGEIATTATKPASWTATTATSSAPSTTVTAGATATPSTVTFKTGTLAASQSSLVDLPASYDSATPKFSVTRDGKTTEVTAASGSVADIAAAFNKTGTGVTASVVNLGTADAPDHRLQITGADTGVKNAFTVASIAADGTSTTRTLTEVRAAADASITLFPGSAAAKTLTSSTNTFTGVLTGVDFTISALETANVTVTVARNDAALSKLASDLVTNLSTVLSEVTSRTSSTTTKAADGGSIVKGGLFSGNSTIRGLQQEIQSVASLPVGTTSPADVGIVLGKDGSFTFNASAFATALAADPKKTQDVVTTIAQRVADVAKAASDPTKGSITAQVTSQQDTAKDLGERVAGWDSRLERRRLTLERTYASLEVALSRMQAQSSYLSAQLEGLNASSGK